MNLIISAKQAGRKHALIEKKVINIEDIGPNPTLQELINAVVTQQVEAFTTRAGEKSILPVFSKTEVDNQAATGKVGFSAIYNATKPDLEKAKETAIQAFEDGLFAVFSGDEEIRKMDEKISLQPDTVITFIRLTFLAGSYW